MRKFASVLLLLLICLALFGQTKKSIELSLIGRYDMHADYVSNFAGRVYNDTNKLYGFSYGINGIFRKEVAKTFSIYAGIGYYQLRIDKIRGSMPFNIQGIRTGRSINYNDDSTRLLYSTSKYWYNNAAITAGVDKDIVTMKKIRINLGVEAIGYFSFSQKYQLLSGRKFYTTQNNKPLEFGINISAGVVKEYRKFYLRPSLILPIFQNLKGDKVFYEDPKGNISKWFNGLGLSLKFGKPV